MSNHEQPVDINHDDSHEYDGITELNNPAPNWILLVLMATIFFSLIYLIHYFGYPENKKDQASEYATNSAAFDQKLAANNPETAVGDRDEATIIAEGAKLFAEKGCIACHGSAGEGNAIGPNLTDNYWINGCKPEEVSHIIAEGNPLKGMTPYKTMMTPKQISSVASYILKSLAGSNPPNAKEAQGTECN